MNVHDALDQIEKRDCTRDRGVWVHHDATRCVEFTHHEAPKLIAALRVGICAACEAYAPCPTARAVTEALGGGGMTNA